MRRTLIVFLLTIVGCNSTINRIDTEEFYDIDVLKAKNNIEQKTLSEIGIDSIENVLLENTRDSKVYNISKVTINSKYIVVFDEISSKIVVFDRKGKFLFKYDSRDKSVRSKLKFAYLANECEIVSIFDPVTQKTNIFSSVGIKTDCYSLDPFFIEFITVNDSIEYTFYPTPRNIFNEGYLVNKYCYEHVTHSFMYENKKEFDPSGLISFFHFRPYKDLIIIWEYYRDAIYSIDSDGKISQIANLRINNDKLNFEKIKSYKELNSKSQESNSITRILFARDHIFFEAVFEGRVHFLLYNKKMKDIATIQYTNNSGVVGIVDDVQYLGGMIPFDVTSNGEFFSILKTVELRNILKTQTNIESEKFRESLLTFSKDGYYIIRIYKYK